jgi:hypothetical protein
VSDPAAGKVSPNYLFALTGNFCSTGTVSTSDIAMKMARFRAHFVSCRGFMEETQDGSFGESVLER